MGQGVRNAATAMTRERLVYGTFWRHACALPMRAKPPGADRRDAASEVVLLLLVKEMTTGCRPGAAEKGMCGRGRPSGSKYWGRGARATTCMVGARVVEGMRCCWWSISPRAAACGPRPLLPPSSLFFPLPTFLPSHLHPPRPSFAAVNIPHTSRGPGRPPPRSSCCQLSRWTCWSCWRDAADDLLRAAAAGNHGRLCGVRGVSRGRRVRGTTGRGEGSDRREQREAGLHPRDA